MTLSPRRFVRAAVFVAVLAGTPPILLAQPAPSSHSAQPAQPAQAPTPAQPAPVGEDALKRETPRGTLLGFVTAAQAGSDAVAAEYLEWPRQRIGITKEEGARQLMFALNHGFEGDLEKLSRLPDGSLTDGLVPTKERVGSIVLASGERVDILLNRVIDKEGTSRWLIASETVAEIPRLHTESGLPEIERALPRSLTRAQFGGLPVWVPLALLILLPIIYGGVRLVLSGLAWLVRFDARLRRKQGPRWLGDAWRSLSNPTAFLVTLYLLGAAGHRIGIPLYHRFMFARTITILSLAGLLWWLWRLQALIAAGIRSSLETTNAGRAQSAYIIGRRALQAVTLVVSTLIILAAFGVDLSATLAGLGIGGLALAFAAQKTLENVFAGISVLGDRTVVVGDHCQIGKFAGTVEDVGLRTMRLRTVGRTIVHVPNGTLATTEVENFSRRDKFLLQTTIGLRFETTPAQLEQVLASIRALLADDVLVEQETQRARLIRLGPHSLDIEVFAFFRVPDYPAFLERQELVLTQILHVVAEAGTGFALPPQVPGSLRDVSAAPGPVSR